MRILVLGATGMLGHKVCHVFRERFDTWATTRQQMCLGWVGCNRTVRMENLGSVTHALARVRPRVVVNCIGIVKQRKADAAETLLVNSLFPHKLARLCAKQGARLVHVSTDCVFSGRRGNYSEDDTPDPEDLYGRSKLLGEVAGPGCLTLRTSFVGRDPRAHRGLVEWLIATRGGRVKGFAKAVFSGLTTLVLARTIADVLERHESLEGVYHVGGDPISKLDLLRLVNDAYGLGVDIEPDEEVVCDRSLDSLKFRLATGFSPPSWPDMVREMRGDDP